MEKEVMMTRLTALTGETDKEILLTFIDLAGAKILEKCYPYHPDQLEVPTRYHNTQLDIAVYLLNKRGAEGETAHNENGINRTYESASVPDSMLKGIIPFVSVLGGTSQ